MTPTVRLREAAAARHAARAALAAALLLGAWADAPARAAGAPAFVLHTAAGKDVIGNLAGLGPDWAVRLGGAGHTPGEEVVSLRRAGSDLPSPPAGEQLVFANGDRVAGKVLNLKGDDLLFRAIDDAQKEWRVPLSALSVIRLAGGDATGRAADLRRLAAGQRRQDVVHLNNGDLLEGELTALDPDQGLRLAVGDKKVSVEADKVAAIALNTALTRRPRPKGPYGHLVLADGSRLALASAASDGEVVTGKTLFGLPVRVPLAQVVALDVYRGRAVYLSDLKPKDEQYRPYLPGDRLHYVRDGSALDGAAAGGELRLPDGTHDKGLGLRGGMRLTYDLGGGYRRFEALVGLDRTARNGSVRVGVLVDGKPRDLGGANELTWANGPRRLAVDVTGARELTLVVDFGRRGSVRDNVDWADARLVKQR
jgi:hypothetical protein